MSKNESRLRRAKRGRMKIRELEAKRLCVHRTSQHIYAQIISEDGKSVLTSASTLDKELRGKITSTGSVDAAKSVGDLVGKRARQLGIDHVAFDRSGYCYHGRVKALADAARESGLLF